MFHLFNIKFNLSIILYTNNLLFIQLVNYLLTITLMMMMTTIMMMVRGEGELEMSRHGPLLTTGQVQRINYPDQIIFPSYIFETSSAVQVTGNTGIGISNTFKKKCVSYDGITGLCIPPSECSVNIHFLFQTSTQRILQCWTTNLICCPDIKPEIMSSTTTIKPEPVNRSVSPPSNILNSSTTTVKPIIILDAQDYVSSSMTTTTTTTPRSSPVTESHHVFGLTSDEAQEVCGVMGNKFKEHTSDKQMNNNNNKIWPWIVTIGYRYQNGTIDWLCLGSLITTEYILTAAHCFQRSPNIVAIGIALLGRMTFQKSTTLDIHTIGTLFTHEMFTIPNMYKNIGLGRLSSPVRVTSMIVPICFPFLAGVLDITQFIGARAMTIGFETSANRLSEINFQPEEYRVLNNSQCSRVFETQKAQMIKRFPNGIRSENMCGLNLNTTLCQAPGAPLVILDSASESYVQIGIASGDPTCSELRRSIVTFTRLNSFSTWVRERVGKLPSSLPCYF